MGLTALPASAASTLSPAQATYRLAADKVCALGNRRLLSAAKDFELQTEVSRSGAHSKKTKVATPDNVVKFVQQVAVTELTTQLTNLKKIAVPNDDQASMKQLFADADKALAAAKSKPGLVAFDDPFKKVI